MVNLISSYEKNGAALYGEFGVAPNAIERYMKNAGYKVQTTDSRNAQKLAEIDKNSDVFITTVYNNQKDITDMVHTVCITKTKDGKYAAHNTYIRDKRGNYVANTADTLEEAISGIGSDTGIIHVIGVKK